MDRNVLKVSMAGFCHDLGKMVDPEVLGLTEEYIQNNADIYQPFRDGWHSHIHALYTACFIETMKHILPRELNSPDWGDGDSFINLAASHHKPETPLQWIITVADRISSGWDRDAYPTEAEENRSSTHNYRNVRLWPIFEQIELDRNSGSHKQVQYRYPLKPMGPMTIFPEKPHSTQSKDKSRQEYRIFFSDFVAALHKLSHRDVNLALWFENFDSLMMKFASAVPSDRSGKVVPDISLYDHSKSVAAISAALYLYHKEIGDLSESSIKDYQPEKFLIINGDFHGIQSFIFSKYGSTRRYRSKILRGRSFAVSLFSELASDMLCREIGLPFSSSLLNVAGKFTMIAPNTEATKKALATVQERINDWLIRISYGENSFGLSQVPAAAADFVSKEGRFHSLWERLLSASEGRKYARFDFSRHLGVVSEYLDAFNNDLTRPLCPFCGKRPSHPSAENTPLVGEAQSACTVCRDHIFLGTNLVKNDRIAVTAIEAEIKGDHKKLMEPIFGSYQLAFLNGSLNEMAKQGHLLRYWDLAAWRDEPQSATRGEIAERYINGYLPVFNEEDQNDQRLFRSRKDESRKAELMMDMELQAPKTLGHIAIKSLHAEKDGSGPRGTEALGILKADVDNLGLIIACGLPEERFSLSRLSTLSRQLNFFFCLYLPHLLSTRGDFKDIYTVFAGGDDLFLIGPWNRVIDLALQLREDFERYVCGNPEIHFSAGIELAKPNLPTDRLAESSEAALEQAKHAGRDRITLFGEVVAWSDFSDLLNLELQMREWLEQGVLTRSFLYRMNEVISMAIREKKLNKQESIRIEDMGCTKWRAFLCYAIERNVGKGLGKQERENAIQNAARIFTQWLAKNPGGLRIPLWKFMYETR